MRKFIPASLVVIALGVTASALIQTPPQAALTLPDLVPAGPLLVLEARNFSSLLRDWNGSQEKRLWLESQNFKVFEQSRLFLRLAEAYEEISQAAGIRPDMAFLEQVAGDGAALALYDIGKLEFLYLARLPEARVAQSLVWQSRENFQPRSAASFTYYVRVDPGTRRTAAVAAQSDYLMIATREDLLAGALALLARQPAPSVKGESWYNQSVSASAAPGDLRLVMNFEGLVRSPHFRSYWIQRNVSELRQYLGGISDAHVGDSEIREERVFLRPQPVGQPEAAPGTGAGVATLIRLVPERAGLYRIWDPTSADQAIELMERKLIAPRRGGVLPGKAAPGINLRDGVVGTEADLEVQIDEAPPPPPESVFDPSALRDLLGAIKLEGLLYLQSSRLLPGNVFVGNQSAVVILASSEWNENSVRDALVRSAETLWTTSRLGIQWVPKQDGSFSYHQLGGLAQLAVATRGRLLIVADGAEPLMAVLERLSLTPANLPSAIYAAGFRHSLERSHFERMTRLMDYPSIRLSETGDGSAREPLFFSENIASLSRALARVESVSILARDTRSALLETLTYRLQR